MIPKVKYNKRNKLSLFIGDEELSPVESINISQTMGADHLITVTVVFISEPGTEIDLLDQINSSLQQR